MPKRNALTLVRDDPTRDPLIGNIKVTREDWLNLARDVLVNEGVGELKILSLAERLSVSRSSFYWYFKNRTDLLNALLEEWEVRNSKQLVDQCKLPASSITEATLNYFRCFIGQSGFDPGLDFAVREWARRDPKVRERIDAADAARLEALTVLFSQHGYSDYDADARARVVYFMQIGYHALELREDTETRINRAAGFVHAFTGHTATQEQLAAFAAFARKSSANI